MRILAVLALGAAFVSPAAAQGTTAITNVSLVDVEEGRVRHGMTVIVRGSRIAVVAPTGMITVPPGGQVVDGRNGWLIPGLWDMHVHLSHLPGVAELYLANGVTGIRDLGGPVDTILAFRDRARRGEILAPRIVSAGPTADGPKEEALFRLTIRSGEDGRRAVDSLVGLGVDLVKTHNGVSREAFFGLLRQARERRVLVAAHLPRTIGMDEAADSGVASLEHTAPFWEWSFRAGAVPASLEALREAGRAALRERAPGLFQRMRERGVWFVPTLVAARASAERIDSSTVLDSTRLRYLHRDLVGYWNRFFPQVRDAPPPTVQGRRELFRASLDLVRAAHEAGVGILAATDVALIHVYPGFSLHDELELLVQSGLSPAEALRAATLNPARHLRLTDSLGTVAEGKLADLVLLDADPLADIGNTRRIRAVLVGGRVFSRTELDRLLRQAAAKAAR